MKRSSILTVAGSVLAGLLAQSASAQVINLGGVQGASGKYSETDPAVADSTGNYQPSLLATRNNTGVGSTDTAKSWLQFDLTSVWSAYGQANLQSATLSLWTQNGTSRSFDVSGLDDGAGLEGWSSGSLSWNNAPGNDPSSEWALDWTKIYGGAPVWQARGGGVANPSTAYANNAYYVSDDLSAFLGTDTDGLVTFITSGPDGINSNTRFWSIAGAWQTDPAQISPILTLTFVPEPTSLSLIMLGAAGLFLTRRRV